MAFTGSLAVVNKKLYVNNLLKMAKTENKEMQFEERKKELKTFRNNKTQE
mgnify:CR=1 FL=1